MRIQNCPMCLLDKPVVRSHLIPQAIYDYCRPPEGNPIFISREVAMETSRQLQDYLLCEDCEDILNRGGESYLVGLLATIEKQFPLYDIVVSTPPDVTLDGFAAYALARNPRIETGKIIHFAMGIFWKAAVHSWSGQRTEPWIDIGSIKEDIRRFLRGEAGFPATAVLAIGITPPRTAQITFYQPYRGSAEQGANFLFYVPGIEFSLIVGDALPVDVRGQCFATNPLHPILVGDLSFAGCRTLASFARVRFLTFPRHPSDFSLDSIQDLRFNPAHANARPVRLDAA
jgi:hypothetical protein